jgi:hypothetical protein
LRIPPDETLWKRYSPHGEAPLSFVGSGATHILVAGLLALFGFLAFAFFSPPLHDLPVDTVHMPGGGGGNPKGEGSGPGIGTGGEELTGDNKDPQSLDPDFVKRPPLTVDEAKALNVEFKDDPAATRFIEEGNEQLKKLARLNKEMRNTLRDGVNPGAGKGGTGEGGGQGIGKGPGKGPGEGSGAPLSTREKRMLRWSMTFNRATYLEQLRDLGAIIAVPMSRNGKKYQVCDLTQQPLRWAEDDLSNNKRIFWIDDKPDSVQALMSQMGRPGHTSYFVALLPKQLEDKLFESELQELKKQGKDLTEDDIYETKFDCIKVGDRYDVVVKSQKLK